MRLKLLSVLTLAILSLSLFVSPIFAQTKPLNFSPQAKTAIHNLSLDILTNGNNPNLTAIKPQLDPGDYQTVKNIGLLPDSPFYFFKNIGRTVRLFFTPNPSSKASQLLKDGNEKTLESLLVLEKANQEKDSKKHQRLINLAAKNLDQVGADFDQVAQTLDQLKQIQPIQVYLLKQEAFTYAGYYLKHQVLLQKQEDQLSEQDFLTVEQARIKHLPNLAHIIVSANPDPVVFAGELSQLIASQVGTNYTTLSTLALLRDLETSANEQDQQPLRKAEFVLQKELEIKLSKLSQDERLKQVERYLSFIHGNPIRQFQAYNQISKNFTSEKMKTLTSALRDKAAQNFKAHLNYLENEDLQKQFVATLFSSYPVDLRLLFYTEVQLSPKVLAVSTPGDNSNEKQKATQLQKLEQIKALLNSQVCQSYGQNPEKLAQTRFYTQNIIKPDVLDLKVAQFLSQSIQSCSSKSPESLKLVTELQAKINSNFITEAKKSVPANKLPTQNQALQILKEENIQVKPGDEQKVAEEIIEETQNIQDSVSEDPAVLEKEIATVIETVTAPVVVGATDQTQTVVNDAEAIIEETITSVEPTQEDIVQKEEEIIEQIEDSAASGETSPLVEELPEQIQEEISQETGIPLPSPSTTPIPVLPSPSPLLPSTTVSPTTAPISSPAPLPTVETTPAPTAEPVPTEEPTLIETVTETVSESASASPEPTPPPTTVTAPSL